MARKLGRATLTVNGVYIETEAGAELDPGGVVGKEVRTGYGIHYAEELMPAVVKGVTTLGEGQSLEALRALLDVDVTFECDTGQVYLVRHAFQTAPPKVTDGEGGKIAIELTGEPAEEVSIGG
jgi:hypothetical protein